MEDTGILLSKTSKGFGSLAEAMKISNKEFDSGTKKVGVFGKSLGVLSGHFSELKKMMLGVGGLIGLHQWEAGLEKMGELQELSMDVARSMGALSKQADAMQGIFQGASELGISYQQMAGAMKAVSKFHANLSLTNKELMEGAKEAAAFGEATGMGAEQGAEMFGELAGQAKLTPKEIRKVQDEFVHLQKTIGLTGDELSQLAKGMTPLIQQIKNMGATADEVQKLVKSAGNMTAGFAAMGKSAGDAAQFMDRLLDPERFNENIVLFNKLGISADKALSAMSGDDTGGLLDQIQERIPEISKQIVAMGPQAGAVMAKQLGFSWRDMINFQKMGTEEAKKRAKELDQERKNEQAFQEELNQTLKSWQRTFISISHQFDAIKMRFAAVLGGENFLKIKKGMMDLANSIIDMLEKIHIDKIISTVIMILQKSTKIFMTLVEPIVDALSKAFDAQTIDKWGDKLEKVFDKVGKVVAQFIDAFGAKGVIGAGLGVLAGKSVMSHIPGAIMAGVQGQGMSGMADQLLTGGMLGLGKRGESASKPLYVQDVAGIGGMLASGKGETVRKLLAKIGIGGGSGAAGGISNIGGVANAAKGLMTKAGYIAAAYAVVETVVGVLKNRETGQTWGKAISESITDTFSNPLVMAAIGSLFGPEGTVIALMISGAANFVKSEKENHRIIGQSLRGIGDSAETTAEQLRVAQKGLEDLGMSAKDLKVTKEQLAVQEDFSDSLSTIQSLEAAMAKNKADMPGLRGQQLQEQQALQKNMEGQLANAMADAVPKAMAVLARGSLSDSAKSAMIKKGDMSGMVASENTKRNARGVIGLKGPEAFNAKAMLDPLKFVNEDLKTQGEVLAKNYGSYQDMMAKNDPKKIQQRNKEITTAVGKSLGAFKYARGEILDQLNKGLISPEEAQKALNKMDEALKQMAEGITDSITTTSAKIAIAGDSFGDILSGMGDKILAALGGEESKKKIAAQGFMTELQTDAIKQITGNLGMLQQFNAANPAGQAAMIKAQEAQIAATLGESEHMQDAIARLGNDYDKKLAEAAHSNELSYKLLQKNLEMQNFHLANISNGTGTIVKHTEETAKNTRKPRKFVDINSLAIRANESRNVFMSYTANPAPAAT